MAAKGENPVWLLIFFLSAPTIGTYGCSKISATAEQGGTISPSGTVYVCRGKSRAFTMTPNAGNTIADVRVDGTPVPIGSSPTYTFTNVQADHSLVVSFITDTGHYKIFNLMYDTAGTKLDSCRTCHAPHTPTPASPLANGYGNDIHAKRTAGYTKYQSLKLIEPNDSDGDGFSNMAEINARRYPGEASDHP